MSNGQIENPTPLAPGITIDRFNELLFTEVDNEFGFNFNDRNAAREFWETATSEAWERAFRLDLEKRSSPFLVCAAGPQTSGYTREISILEAASDPFADTASLSPIYNRVDESCFFIRLRANVAANIDANFRVQPLSYPMKLMKDSVKIARDDQPFSNPIFEVGLCPGVYDSENTNGRAFENEAAFKQSVLQYLLPNEETNVAPISSDLFWQSVAQPNEQGIFWINTVQTAIRNQLCVGAFQKLSFQFDLSMSTQYTTTSMVIEFPKKVGLVDKSCVMHLLLGLALVPETCSINVRPELKTFNVNAQWITQSGTPDHRPFFDVGITGDDQVVGISDTGLDIDNCYFWDESLGSFFERDAVSAPKAYL